MKHIFYLVITSLFLSTPNLHAAPVQFVDYDGIAVPMDRGAVLTSRYTYLKEVKNIISGHPGGNPAFFDLLTQAKDKDMAEVEFSRHLEIMGEKVRLNDMRSIGQKLPKRIAIVAHGGKEFIRVDAESEEFVNNVLIRFEGSKLAKQLAPFIDDDSLIDIVACKAFQCAEKFAAELKRLGIRAKVRGFPNLITPKDGYLIFEGSGESRTRINYRKFLLTGFVDETEDIPGKGARVVDYIKGFDTTLEKMSVPETQAVEWYEGELEEEELVTRPNKMACSYL
ncbi:MAG: hypothetical protein P8O97_01085 [Gammaproteobacteria bacterium]|nr:hypothetical protein [Gammaproteobacteria bacterium]